MDEGCLAEALGYAVGQDGALFWIRPFIDDVADRARVDYVVACPIAIELGFDIDDHGYLHRAKRRGERHPGAKLNEAAVRKIRAGLAAGESMESLARRFGVKSPAIRKIRDGVTWRHVK
ncbi:hypothetical protein KHP62_16485 [Rhodobacteraceae bacterium NNCM2]|nr:hypothetical protein [Coraliihabitans acroporae]